MGDFYPGSVEALEVEGKRRRLRRKRAASPDSAYLDDGGSEHATLVAAPVPATPRAAASTAQSQPKDTMPSSEPKLLQQQKQEVQRVVRQVAKLSVMEASGTAAGSSQLPVAAQTSVQRQQQESEVAESNPAPVSVAPAMPIAATEPQAASEAENGDGGGCGGSSAPTPPAMQRGLLESLSLARNLSVRIASNLQSAARARGLSLPPQLTGAGGSRAGQGGDETGGKSCSDPGEVALLHTLLGGSLVDRADLLGRTALHVAAAAGRADVVRALAAAQADLNRPLPMDYRTPLRRHPDIDAERRRAARRAAVAAAGGKLPDRNEWITPAQAMAEAEAELEDEEEEEERACKRGRLITGAAVPRVRPPSLQYCTPLHLAALYGHLAAVDALLAPGGSAPPADPAARSLEGATPLHLAALAGHEAVVARLCRAPGALPGAADHQGRTPLHLAAARGRDGVVVELWARGAPIDPTDSHGWTREQAGPQLCGPCALAPCCVSFPFLSLPLSCLLTNPCSPALCGARRAHRCGGQAGDRGQPRGQLRSLWRDCCAPGSRTGTARHRWTMHPLPLPLRQLSWRALPTCPSTCLLSSLPPGRATLALWNDCSWPAMWQMPLRGR